MGDDGKINGRNAIANGVNGGGGSRRGFGAITTSLSKLTIKTRRAAMQRTVVVSVVAVVVFLALSSTWLLHDGLSREVESAVVSEDEVSAAALSVAAVTADVGLGAIAGADRVAPPPTAATATATATVSGAAEREDRKIYECGWDQGRLPSLLFPDYVQGGRLEESAHENHTSRDIIVNGMGGTGCGGHDVFPGTQLIINGEGGEMFTARLGPSRAGSGEHKRLVNPPPEIRRDPDAADIYFFGLASLLGQYEPEIWDYIFRHESKPTNTGERYLMYLVSRCHDYRERAFDELAKVGTSTAYYGGKCNGLVGAVYQQKRRSIERQMRKEENDEAEGGGTRRRELVNKINSLMRELEKRANIRMAPSSEITPRNSVIKSAADKLKARRMKGHNGGNNQTYANAAAPAPWRDNYLIFRNYRFCLVMENKSKPGYITEKIVNAFLGGCVPIYWGTKQVFDIFNPNAFIYYDPTNSRSALDRVSYLERNRTAYDEMLRAEPILADGVRTIEKYFSYSDDIGNGTLKRRIREGLLGL